MITEEWVRRVSRDSEAELMVRGAGAAQGGGGGTATNSAPGYPDSLRMIRQGLSLSTDSGAWVPAAVPALPGYSPVAIVGYSSNEELLPTFIQPESIKLLPRILIAAVVLGIFVGVTMYFVVTVPLRRILEGAIKGRRAIRIYEVDSVAGRWIEDTRQELRRGTLLKDSVRRYS